MKRIIFFFLLLCSVTAGAQTYIGPQGNYGIRFNRVKVDSTFILPSLADTLIHSSTDSIGSIKYASQDGSLRRWSGSAWSKISLSVFYTGQTITASGATTISIPAKHRLYEITFLPSSGSQTITITNTARTVMPSNTFNVTVAPYNPSNTVAFNGVLFDTDAATTLTVTGITASVTMLIDER